MDGTIPFVPFATYSEPASPCRFSQFPPAFVGLAARPRAPTSPAMLTLERRALPKLGEAGALLLAVAQGRRLLEGWVHGVGRQSRRRRIVARWGALLALGCRQMRGGWITSANRSSHEGACMERPAGNPAGVAGAPRYSRVRVLNIATR
jgi:hypothetical protein